MAISFADSFQVLLLQLADAGRGAPLLGGDESRARTACLPFMVGKEFPSVYFEFPLVGEPFLDVTILYGDVEPGTRVESDLARDTEGIFDWYAEARDKVEGESICFGFELDTSCPELPRAAIHFQPRGHTELVRPFLEAAGEPERADLYLDLAARMPQGWDLAFFGMFRGRPGSPLRVCGYLPDEERLACADDPSRVAAVFDAVGFEAYDGAMLQDVSAVLSAAPCGADFQFDVYPDGRIGDIFAIDSQFGIEQPSAVRESFASGVASHYIRLLEQKGMVDERWHLAVDAAFARGLPAEFEDGVIDIQSFTLMPQWAKTRWTAGVLQPAKMYHFGKATRLERG